MQSEVFDITEPVREPSTFIPPELTDQELFSDTLEKGALFEKFFEATVQVTRGGIGGSNCQISPIKYDLNTHIVMLLNFIDLSKN